MKVELLDKMGSDASVANAARVSFAKQVETIDPVKDGKLISYLAKHKHWTPFGHCFASFRIKAPIFVARQLAKHQIGLCWNEVSRRYVDQTPEFYKPTKWRGRADNVKQGSSSDAAQLLLFTQFCLDNSIPEAIKLYNRLLESGVCPEQARMVLPQSMMTEWIWSGSLAAFARVCKLRLDPHAQLETQEVANHIAATMLHLFPISWKALMNEITD